MKKLVLLSLAVLSCACSHHIDDTAPKPVRVKTLSADATEISGTRSYSGTVEESSGVALSFLTVGTLRQMYVGEGDRVRAGQLIAAINDDDLRNAYDIAAATLAQATDAHERMKKLHDSGSLPDMQWVEVENTLTQARSAEAIAKKALADAKLYAPTSGYIARKMVDAGSTVGPGLPVVQLVTIDPVKVSVSIPENEIGSFEGGQKAMVTVGALGGEKFEGVISEKGVEADPLTRAYQIKIRLSNPDGRLLPGMIADVVIDREKTTKAVILPMQAVLLDSDNHNFVWLARDNKAFRRTVTVDGLTDRGIVISGGINPGDSVIIEGQQKVSEGQEIEVINHENK